MDKKVLQALKEEVKIPEKVLGKITEGRAKIIQGQVLQEKPSKKSRKIGKLIITLAIAASILLILITKNPVSAAIENAFGISRDSGVATIEDQGIADQMDLVSTQNGQEIKLTKFVATKKKFAFDYQFKIEDKKLKELLDKMSAADVKWQDIQLGLFAEGNDENLFGGVSLKSTYEVKNGYFYGTVIANFINETIPDNAKLILHIYQLAWVDQAELERAKNDAENNNINYYSVPNALVYQGDWQYQIDNPILTQVANTEIFDVNQISDIKTKGDALQTSVKFNIPTINDELEFPSIDVKAYKNGVEVAGSDMISKQVDDQTQISIWIDLSALDTSSVYEIKVFQVDVANDVADEIGHFKLKNK
ncbi:MULTISPECIES: DUF4179 domain-containing protein [unclassified Enterococcus]|uniref:DUF4179 domain-containing protein n=1 Tax=unclassified Enterococcus TaxID=2608891 RepID=UPI001551DBEC|nr:MULTISPECIES: DUF4179 domain-containing protein [unclassified Enterococcus]MBS7578364.1 DUF4179 domain-containing protein [Enterococcus sp. MMGLQ5-2]MBS7585548.1 DUF4179 domain-containing protein [Enterococcus sp. MMGLQ5-1]NPD13407.1 DUF4179 domain-containing protein [Enterococcus sp. MMGLQ5-1]NPD38196.1 DUF4179 domain-containing protein [Enterococcus sp. MMGLQ5-2]